MLNAGLETAMVPDPLKRASVFYDVKARRLPPSHVQVVSLPALAAVDRSKQVALPPCVRIQEPLHMGNHGC